MVGVNKSQPPSYLFQENCMPISSSIPKKFDFRYNGWHKKLCLKFANESWF